MNQLITAKLAASPKPNWKRWRGGFFLLLFGCACFAFWGAVQPSSLNRIQRENRQPGTTAWQLTNPADDRQIEGYASLTSVPVGGDIDLFVNTKDVNYTLTVFRLGWYGGKGGRKVLGPQTLPGVGLLEPALRQRSWCGCTLRSRRRRSSPQRGASSDGILHAS